MLRIKDWLYSFIPIILGNLYLWIYIFGIQRDVETFYLLAFSLITSLGFSSLGYLLNEFSDIVDDRIAGKLNVLSGKKHYQVAGLFLFSSLLAFLPWLYLPSDYVSFFLIFLQLSSFILYSIRPFRFKKILIISNLLDTFYAYLIPQILSAYTFFLFSDYLNFPKYLLIYFIVFFIVGFRNILIHQIDDIFYDKNINNFTLPRKIGIGRTDLLLRGLIVSEFFTITLFLVLMAIKINLYLTTTLIFVFYRAYYLLVKRKEMLSNFIVFFEIREGFNSIYQIWLPLVFITFLAFNSVYWILIYPIHLLLFADRIMISKIVSGIKTVVSVTINYTIYYLFRAFGINLKEKGLDAIAYIKSKR